MIASVEETDGPNQVLGENGQRRIAVLGNADGERDMAAIVADIRAVIAETKWPQGYVTALEGTFQAQEEATIRIGLLSIVSLVLIFVVLYSRYQSSVLALIIMGNIPLALIGSVIALNIACHPGALRQQVKPQGERL
jgi:HME family heavy-metal exporter